MANESSPEVILALEEATQDEDIGVTERARKALEAEVHQRMALKMGKLELLKHPESVEQAHSISNDEQQIKSQEPITPSLFSDLTIGAFSGIFTFVLIYGLYSVLLSVGLDSTSFLCCGSIAAISGAIGVLIAKSVSGKLFNTTTSHRIIFCILGGVLGGFFAGSLFITFMNGIISGELEFP